MLDAVLQDSVFEDMRATLLNGHRMTLDQFVEADARQRTRHLLQRVDFYYRQTGKVPVAVVILLVVVELCPFFVVEGLLIRVTQALKTFGVVVRTGLFEKGSVLAFDTARIGVGRQAQDGPATHCVYNSMKTCDATQ